MANCTWTGKSGETYSYTIYPIDTSNWSDVGGNYIFAKPTSPSSWTSVYIGQTDSFKNRLPNHEKRPCAIRNGATHIHARVNTIEQDRLREERDLLDAGDTPCNDI